VSVVRHHGRVRHDYDELIAPQTSHNVADPAILAQARATAVESYFRQVTELVICA